MKFIEDIYAVIHSIEPSEFYTLLLVIFTAVLAVSTIGLWIVSWRAARQTAKAASAAEEANHLSRAIFTTGNRPWITARIFLTSPLSHSEEDGWHIQIKYVLKNIGSSPAANVSATGKLMPMVLNSWTEDMLQGRSVFEMPTLGTDGPTELKKLADNVTAMRGAGFGHTLFPNEEITGLLGIYTSRCPLFERAKELGTFSGQLHLLFCASYGFTFDDSRHVTAKAFIIYKTRDHAGKWGDINLEGEQVGQDKLGLVPAPLSNSDFAT